MKLVRLYFGLLLWLVISPSLGQDLTEKLPIAADVIKGKLTNGLTYYIRKNAKPEQRVELRLAIKAGSILEEDDQQGLAHFTEHMAFNGSKHFKKNDLVSYLQSIGVEFGADLNAYTSFDETVYILPIPTDRPENLERDSSCWKIGRAVYCLKPKKLTRSAALCWKRIDWVRELKNA